ncbi:MAG: LemA family protein [bacterium]
MKTGTKVLLAVLAVILLVAGMFVSSYNKLVTFDTAITGAWSQVENVLQRRNDLIPNLVNTVKGYAKHEKTIFEDVAMARTKLAGASSLEDKVKASNELGGALGRLLAIAENYPQLKANTTFEKLMDELAGTENRIAVERKRYNEVVLEYNLTVKRFPGNIIAGMMNFKTKDVYFKAEEKAKTVPAVNFE